MQRTKDSGTRRCETQGAYYPYNGTVGIYIYDYTNNIFYTPTVLAATTYGGSPNGVVGPAGFANANMKWGYGYVGGGDIANSLNNASANNQAIAYLSMGDSKSVPNGSSGHWGNVISYNGIWPTAAGAGLNGNTGTNHYSPITLGYYPNWGFEVLVHPENPGVPGRHNHSRREPELRPVGRQPDARQLHGRVQRPELRQRRRGNGGQHRKRNHHKPARRRTAIPLAAMANQRPSVGGTIYPPFN